MHSHRVRGLWLLFALIVGALALIGPLSWAVTDAQPGPPEVPLPARAVLPLLARDAAGPLPDDPEPYPPGTRSGAADVNAVIEALESASPDALKALFELTPAPCVVNPQSLTNPPLCPEGVAAGTPTPVFRATACESVWPEYLEEVLTQLWQEERPLLAIYQDPSDAYGWLPAANYAIVATRGQEGGQPFVIRVKDGRVNGIAFGCGQSFPDLVADIEDWRYLLPPQSEPQ
jgi:hypothetical protein